MAEYICKKREEVHQKLFLRNVVAYMRKYYDIASILQKI